jgi:hypothetical protein
MDTTTSAKGSLASQALADNTNPRLPNSATGDANVRVGALGWSIGCRLLENAIQVVPCGGSGANTIPTDWS